MVALGNKGSDSAPTLLGTGGPGHCDPRGPGQTQVPPGRSGPATDALNGQDKEPRNLHFPIGNMGVTIPRLLSSEVSHGIHGRSLTLGRLADHGLLGVNISLAPPLGTCLRQSPGRQLCKGPGALGPGGGGVASISQPALRPLSALFIRFHLGGSLLP